MPPVDMTLFDWIYQAEGVFFWPQLILAFVSITHLLACFDLLWLMPLGQGRLPQLLREARVYGDAEKARDAVRAGSSDLARIARLGFEAVDRGVTKEQLEEELGMACDEVDLGYERRLTFLNMLAQVNMLVGLLGTVWGLVGSFLIISQTNVAPPPRELAAGVSQALVTTIWGLLLAIPALFFFVLLRGSASRLSFELQQNVARLVPLMERQREGGATWVNEG